MGTTLYSMEVRSSSYIVVRDFVFKSTASTLLKIAGTTNSQIIRNDFDFSGANGGGQNGIVTSSYNSTAPSSDDNEIAYNNFRDHTFPGNDGQTLKSGSFIKTQLDASTLISNRLWIHHNYFKNMAPHMSAGATTPDGDSDREAIVLGTSSTAQMQTNHLIENNLFEDCDGENEIITVKTSNNILRYNTFKNSMGSLSVRFGQNTEVYGNYFYGEGASATYTDPNYQTGGIRVYGKNHKIYNNYMQNLTGTSWRLPILLDSGDSDSDTTSGHQRPQYVEITNNTIVNSAGGLNVGSGNYSSQPKNNKIANNLVVGSNGSLFYDQGDSSNTWQSNIAYATGSASNVGNTSKTSAQVLVTDPQLANTTKNGLSVKTLGSSSPAINASTGIFSYVTTDIDGETRSTPDIGADEYSATPSLTYKPLQTSDVGPSAN